MFLSLLSPLQIISSFWSGHQSICCFVPGNGSPPVSIAASGQRNKRSQPLRFPGRLFSILAHCLRRASVWPPSAADSSGSGLIDKWPCRCFHNKNALNGLSRRVRAVVALGRRGWWGASLMEEPPIIVLVSVATRKNGPKAQQDVNTMRVPRQSFRADSDCDQSERSHQQQQQQSLCCCWAVIACLFKLFLSYFVHMFYWEK